MQDLFHGSIHDFDKIDVSFGRGYKDFGKGFYATSVKSHAESIAKRNKKNADDREIRIKQRNSSQAVFFQNRSCNRQAKI